MEFLNFLGINSTAGIFGLALLVIGGFMFLAGVGIISIQQVTVKQGRTTWLLGLAMAVVGLVLLFPEFSTSSDVSSGEIEAVETQPSPTLTSTEPINGGVEWKSIEITVPQNGLWLEEDGSYSAIGSIDTIAWSDKIFEGDLELSLDIESSRSFTAANIIVYGDGVSLSSGNLIFTVANDLQAILADSIYDNGTFLSDTMGSVKFGEQKHSVLIRIIDRKASLYLDEEEIASVFLDENINTNGRIGLLKWGGIHDMTFSNPRIMGSETAE